MSIYIPFFFFESIFDWKLAEMLMVHDMKKIQITWQYQDVIVVFFLLSLVCER